MDPKFDLLSTVEYGGCSSKLPAGLLSEVLKELPVAVDPNLLVDVDTHGDINGFESLPLLGDLPDTAVARTPSGGAHYVFKNDGTPPPRKISLVRGIDLLSNGYIVAAPSVIDGKPYSWESQAVVSLPQSVRDMAAPKVHTVPSGIAPRSPATKDRDHTMHRAS